MLVQLKMILAQLETMKSFYQLNLKKVRSLVQDVNISILLIVPQTLLFVADVDASSTLPRDKVKLNLTNQTKSNIKELIKDFYAK